LPEILRNLTEKTPASPQHGRFETVRRRGGLW
jgi:hypothetical protein